MSNAELIKLMKSRIESEKKEIIENYENENTVNWASQMAQRHASKRVISELKFILDLIEP